MSANTLDRDEAFETCMGPIRARPTGARAAMGMGLCAWIILAAAALLVRQPATHVSEAETAPAAPSPAKITAKASTEPETASRAAAASLGVDAPEFEREKKIVSVAQAKDGESRVDSLTAGQFAMGAPYLRLDIHPELEPGASAPDFFLDMNRHAKAVGLNVARIGQRATLSTRFGAFETAEIRLSQPGADGLEASDRNCLATRLFDPKVPLEIAGIACGSAARPIDRVALACLLDKVNYSAGSDNKALNEFFLNAELARGRGCVNVSRDDMTASIPRSKTAASAKPAQTQVKKVRAVASAPRIHPDATKN